MREGGREKRRRSNEKVSTVLNLGRWFHFQETGDDKRGDVDEKDDDVQKKRQELSDSAIKIKLYMHLVIVLYTYCSC